MTISQEAFTSFVRCQFVTTTDSDKEIRANKLEIFREREFRQTATTARFCFRIFSLPFVLFFEKSLGRTLILSKEYDRMKQFKCFSVQGYHHFLFVSFFVSKALKLEICHTHSYTSLPKCLGKWIFCGPPNYWFLMSYISIAKNCKCLLDETFCRFVL